MRIARIALAFVGAISIVLASLGLWYNFTTLAASYSTLMQTRGVPYFYRAFYIMSAICIACYAVLFFVGVQMVRGQTNVVRLFVLLIVFEVLYFFTLGTLWLLPEYGMSIAAATGVANGGLMFQAFALFPLWAPVIAFLASRSLREMDAAGT